MARRPSAAVTGATRRLQFSDGPGSWRSSAEDIAGSLSAVVGFGRFLWVSSDQTATVERLTADDSEHPTAYREHLSYRLNDFVTLPQRGKDKDTEVDVEGSDLQWLSSDIGYLWLIGSHSRARDRVTQTATPRQATDALASVGLNKNRCVLLRIPIVVGDDGLPRLVPSYPDPAARSGVITAGLMDDLADAIAEDDHLKPFAALPGKDNGLDVEGLAVTDDGRVYAGLRGPVLRGWAVVLALAVETAGTLKKGQRLQVRKGDGFRKHFLDLGGLVCGTYSATATT